MIEPETADKVRRLLRDGRLSQRKIAILAGVSRGTVANIAKGKWRMRVELSSGPAVWCPVCRAKVQMPCVACRVRAWMRKRGTGPDSAGPTPGVGG